MVNQTRAAIIAIGIIIPLSSIAVLNSAESLELIETPSQNQKIVALASFYPLYEFTKEIGGDKVAVSLIVPTGVEPHDWEPTIQDLQKLQRADLIVINGIGFENWVDKIDSINYDVLIVDTSVGISLIENEKYVGDPHIWLDPVLAKRQVDTIAEALIEIEPLNEKYYVQNSNSYKAKLESLDNKIRKELATCKKDFIAFHKAFFYFANQYGLNQHTILTSGDPHEDPTAKSLQKVINLAKAIKMKVIFTEEAVDARTAEVIAHAIGGKVLTLSPLEVVDSQESYIEKMEQNLANLKEALCS